MADQSLAGTKRGRNNGNNGANGNNRNAKRAQPLIPRNEIASWIIYSIRRTMGEWDVRNEILKAALPADPKRILGSTFVLLYNADKPLEPQINAYNAKIKKYIDTITHKSKKGKTILFTVANPPSDEGAPETHYQTVIVKNTDAPTAIFIDPAHRSDGSEGIYSPMAINDTVKPHLEAKGYTTSWLPVYQAAQTDEKDVFCQSWSLYLLKEGILHPDSPVEIPKKVRDRYEILLNFWKQAASLPLFCSVLASDYTHVVENDLIEQLTEAGKNEKSISEIVDYYKSFNPCTFIQTMTVADIENA